MKRVMVSFGLLVLVAVNGFAAGKGPEIQIIDGKVSIQADALPLSRFLHLLDAATGMTSKVPQEFANTKISVRLSDMDLPAAIRKSFQGQPWNYSIIPGKGINILDRAVAVTAPTGSSPSSSPAPVQTFVNDFQNNNGNPAPPPAPVSSAPINPPANNNAGNAPAAAAPSSSSGPAPLFQTPGTSLGGALPTALPGR